MRLTCPNCSARYEVSDEMIPPDGRDVQCSNCATTWFQPGAHTIASTQDAQVEAPKVKDDTAQPPPQHIRREIDPAIRDLLREEADREERLRHGQQETSETKKEMPLDRSVGTPRRTDDDIDEPEEEAEFDDAIDGAVTATMAAGSRRDLLPDIEEINSTLRATSDRNTYEDIETMEETPRRRRGMRFGFLLTLIIVLCLVLIYSNAAQIAAQVPEATPYLQGYVEKVNAARFWLDDLAQDALDGATAADN